MKPYGFVYITTNMVSGMLYIGQTHYSDRMRSDYFGSGKAITRAIRKYGKSAFKREIIFEAFTKDDLDWAETFFIVEHDAVKSRKFYNISPGGRASLGFTGKKHSPERNKSLSEKMMGHKVSDKVREVARALGKEHGKTLNTLKATCPHCSKTGQKGLMHRWHFDNCKLKDPSPQ